MWWNGFECNGRQKIICLLKQVLTKYMPNERINQKSTLDKSKNKPEKIIIIKQRDHLSPWKTERMMTTAYSVALNCLCLCRSILSQIRMGESTFVFHGKRTAYFPGFDPFCCQSYDFISNIFFFMCLLISLRWMQVKSEA